jgi:glycosyltransferase involved in cell wall biosynthesis
MRCLHIMPGLDPRLGGISAAVPRLAEAIRASGRYEVGVLAFCSAAEGIESEGTHQFEVVRLSWPSAFSDIMVRNKLHGIIAEYDVVHLHGLWQLYGWALLRAAEAQNKIILVAAHGMLDRWALANRRWKKLVYSVLIERRNLRRASCLHALTETEAQDYRRYGLQAPIAVIPNGVQVPESVDSETFYAALPELRGRKIVLFLGRLHYKKGLDLLCRAWAEIHGSFPDAHLVIAGPDSENTLARIEALVAKFRLSSSVTFAGMLSGSLKWAALAAATVFVLPSYSEGFSMAILEALALGVPVLITRHCNFPEVAHRRCGWVTEAATPPVASALAECLTLPEESRSELSSNARSLIQRRYEWGVIGRQMTALYDSLCGAVKPLKAVVP